MGAGPAGFLMPKDLILTPQGLEELKAKIEHLSGPRRREVAERIKEAREFGDITENSEYDDAKNEQAMLEKQIAELEEKLRSRLGDRRRSGLHRGGLGRHDRPREGPEDRQVASSTQIVGSAEANPAERSSPTSRRSARR